MTTAAKKMSGYILLSVPTIIYGGYFLLTVLSGNQDHFELTNFQKSMFRAGHAHAGVLVILALVIQPFVDQAKLSSLWKGIVSILFPLSAIIISMGFFAAAIGDKIEKPTEMIYILYTGMITLIIGLIALGIGLIKN